MKTLNDIAENVAYKLGQQFNDTLLESIKHTIVNYRAKFIRDDVEKNGLITASYYQRVTLDFQQTNILEDTNADLACLSSFCNSAKYKENYIILKSTKQLPSILKLKSNTNNAIRYAGSVDRTTRFKQIEPELLPFVANLPYQLSQIKYYISNNYVYLLNTKEVCNMLFEAIFDNPRDVFSFCNSDKFKDDNEFPISNDLLYFIERGIVSGEYPLLQITDEETVNIKKDDKNKVNA